MIWWPMSWLNLICIVESNGNLLGERINDNKKYNSEMEQKPSSADELNMLYIRDTFAINHYEKKSGANFI